MLRGTTVLRALLIDVRLKRPKTGPSAIPGAPAQARGLYFAAVAPWRFAPATSSLNAPPPPYL